MTLRPADNVRVGDRFTRGSQTYVVESFAHGVYTEGPDTGQTWTVANLRNAARPSSRIRTLVSTLYETFEPSPSEPEGR